MFVHYECLCGARYKTLKADQDLHLLSIRMSCPRQDCAENIEIASADLESHNWELVDAKSLFGLCMGLGSAAERQCSPSALLKSLQYGVIQDIDLEGIDSDPNRSIINKMMVGIDWGTENSKSVAVYFATSVKGATIYKVVSQ